MKKIILFFMFIVAVLIIKAQDNNANIWYFGENAGVDFSYGIPNGITDGQLDTWEGCASVCDQQGGLLFYTDGQTVYNRNHQIMPNGSGILGDYSASQSSIIVPKPSLSPGNNIYYIFTVDCWQDDLVNGLRYSVVDMSLEGGLGDITSEKNILLHDQVAEKITAIHHSNYNDIWILTHDWGSNDYLAFKLTEDSVWTNPVVTSAGYNYTGSYNLGAGQLRFSKDGDYFVSTMNYIDRFELFRFNRTTGELSDMLEFQDSNFLLRSWGAEFSPNGRYLYIAKRPPEILLQFDLQTWDYSSVLNSAVAIETTSGSTGDYDAGSLQMGPNGKIYLTRYDKTYLSVINQPNNIGTSCDFEEIGVDLNGRLCKWGLPNLFYFKGFQFFTGSEVDITICEGDSVYLENAYQTIEGIYHDTVQSFQGWDSIVNTNLVVLESLPTPIISEAGGILSSSSSINYQWYFNGNLISGATNQDYQPFVTGTYQVVSTNTNGCESWSNEYNFILTELKKIWNNLNVYPNPVSNIINIDYTEPFSIHITDLNGRIIYNENVMSNNKNLDITSIENGVYILKIITLTKVKTMKIIKQ